MASAIYVTGIELKNIRAFEQIFIDLKDEDDARMLSVIIGRNGTCKSTILRCVALGLCQDSDATVLLSESAGQLVSEGAEEGYITLHVTPTDGADPGEITLAIGNKDGHDVLLDRRSSVSVWDYFVCGYGAGRGNIGGGISQERRSGGHRVMDSVASLFDYHRSLVHSELMLRRLQDYLGTSRYEHAMRGIKRVLGLREEHEIQYARGGGVMVSGPGIGSQIPLDAWADGYRMTFNWMIDLYGWAMLADAIGEDGGIRGVLLIDEIEQHLHPSMQMELLNELRRALPEMQVMASTHSPLTALGTQAENIVALHRVDRNIMLAEVPSLTGYSAEDVLAEETLFGTDPYPGYTRLKLRRHRELAAIPPSERSESQAEELRDLTAELDPENLPGFGDEPLGPKLDELVELLKRESNE